MRSLFAFTLLAVCLSVLVEAAVDSHVGQSQPNQLTSNQITLIVTAFCLTHAFSVLHSQIDRQQLDHDRH
jgi:hypothetical protein